jgi:iron complex transport system substrate-binding protein
LAHAIVIGHSPLFTFAFDTIFLTFIISTDMKYPGSDQCGTGFWFPRWLAAITLWLILLPGCGRGNPAKPATSGKSPTVASLVPSATDLLIGMGGGDHLVAVSDFDRQESLANLPRIGGYDSIDWEKVAGIKPGVIITWYGPDQTPRRFVDRTRELNIQSVNLSFARLSDVFHAITVLGNICREPAKASELSRQMRKGLDSVHRKVSGEPPVRAIISTSASGRELAGRDTYLDDLLTEAGGQNAVQTVGYKTLDPEAIAALRPEVVLQLMPEASEATKAQAMRFWKSLPDLPAVKDQRVWQYTEAYIMQPGAHVADVAALFGLALHPKSMERANPKPMTRALP